MTRALRSTLLGIGAVLAAGVVATLVFLAPRRSAPMTTVEDLRARYTTEASRFVDVNGVRVHYADEGSGPVLVLLHGSFGSLRTFDDMVPRLAAKYRVLRYDQPPGGLSGPVDPGFRMTMEGFLHAFLERVGASRVALLGTSSGGIIAYRYAATYPDDVTALVLTNVPPSAPVDNAGARRRTPMVAQLSSRACAALSRPLSRPQSQTCWRDFLGSMFVREARVTDALVERYYDLNRHPGARQFTSMTAIMRDDAKVRDFLGRVRAPTLLLWSREDPVLPPATAATMASRLTGAPVRTEWLENVSHYPPIEAPDEVADATLRFLDSIAPR